jgi:uncharacterized protein (TIGR02145 family)
MWDGKDWKRMAGETPLSYPNCSPLPVGLLASLYGTKDADGNLRIDIPSGLDARGAISPFNLTVTSDPLGSLTAVADTYNNGGVVFNPAQTWTIGQLQASPTVYDNLQAADMSSGVNSGTAADPWETRQTVLTFSGKAGCPPVTDTRTVTLNQTNYAIVPSTNTIILSNTNDNNFTIGSNVTWKVKSIDDPYSIMTTTMTNATTGGTNRNDNNQTTSENYIVRAGINQTAMKYATAIITLEDTNNPKKAKDIDINITQCMGIENLSNITKKATPEQTAAGDPNWNTGTTKADKVVLHLAKKNPNYNPNTDPAYMENIYEDFTSADFGPAGRWMTMNLAAHVYDSNAANLPKYPGNSSAEIIQWCYPNGYDNPTSYNAYPNVGLLYSWLALRGGIAISGSSNAIAGNVPGPNEVEVQYETVPNSANGHIQGICPNGWHIPSDREWGKLEKEIWTNYELYTTNTMPFTSTYDKGVTMTSDGTPRTEFNDEWLYLTNEDNSPTVIGGMGENRMMSGPYSFKESLLDICGNGGIKGTSKSIHSGGFNVQLAGLQRGTTTYTWSSEMYAATSSTYNGLCLMRKIYLGGFGRTTLNNTDMVSVRCVKD